MISDEVASLARAIHAASGLDDIWPDLTRAQRIEITNQAHVAAATPGVLDAFRDTERLRNLAARFEGHLNRGQTFTGAEIAAMLRGDADA